MTPAVAIRPMLRNDTTAVAELESTVSAEPWSVALFEGEFDVAPGTRQWFVAQEADTIVGFAGMMFVGLSTDEGEGHLMNVAVAPTHQRRGIARMLCRAQFADAAARGFDALTLEVRLTNHAAIELYRSFGFAPVGTRKNYYTNPDGSKEDGLIMWLHDNLQRAAEAERCGT